MNNMGESKISKISIDMKNFYEVEGNIDEKNKNLNFEMSEELFEKIFQENIHSFIFLNREKENKTGKVYVITEDERIYSCIGCFFSIKSKKTVKFSSVAINIILKNLLNDSINVNTKKLTFKTKYIGNSKHACYISNFTFNYDYNKTIEIKTYRDGDFFIEISIRSKKEYSYEKLSDITYTIIEMIMLLWGDIPIIEEIYCETADKNVYIIYDIVEKYKAQEKIKNGNGILSCICNETINKNSIKKFQNFRNQTKIIYDLFMININDSGYKEIKNCNLIQIMEGLYRTVPFGDKKNLKDIIKYYFEHSDNAKNLLSKKDKINAKDKQKTEIFIYKAYNHRNYLSHLNQNEEKNVFYKLENIYAFWKICLAIRIVILEYLGIKYDENYLKQYINDIDKWKENHKIRFSLRENQ